MRKSYLPRAELLLSRKTALWERLYLVANKAGNRGSDNSEEGLILAGRRKMKIHVVEEQVHRDRVVRRYLHDGIRGQYLDGVALHRKFQFLNDLENIVANLIFGVAIHHREARLFQHLVRELIVRNIDRHNLDRGIDDEQQDHQVNDGLDLAFSPFGAAVQWRAAISEM